MYKKILIALLFLNAPLAFANIANDIANDVPINQAVQRAVGAQESPVAIVKALQAVGFSTQSIVIALLDANVEPATIVIVLESSGVELVEITTALLDAGVDDAVNIVATALDLEPAIIMAALIEGFTTGNTSDISSLKDGGGGSPEHENSSS